MVGDSQYEDEVGGAGGGDELINLLLYCTYLRVAVLDDAIRILKKRGGGIRQ